MGEIESENCDGSTGGIKNIFLTNMPLGDISKMDFMSEVSKAESESLTHTVEFVILSPKNYKLVKEIKQMIKDADRTAEECYQELNDEQQGDILLAKVEAWKEVIKKITNNKPILNND